MTLGLKERGNVVAVTGDARSDSLGLKIANIGISMGYSGTDYAKDVSDIIFM
jgi:magnesium-transporting ATPase (P-type)